MFDLFERATLVDWIALIAAAVMGLIKLGEWKRGQEAKRHGHAPGSNGGSYITRDNLDLRMAQSEAMARHAAREIVNEAVGRLVSNDRHNALVERVEQLEYRGRRRD